MKSKEETAVEKPSFTTEPISEREQNKAKLRKFVEEESQLVKGRFRNYETPGGSLRVQVKKYKELPMFDRWLEDNKVYEVPLYVARHLNGVDKTAERIGGKINTCSYAVHAWKHGKNDELPPCSIGAGANGEPGIPVPLLSSPQFKRRYGFESLEFDTNT